MKKIRFVSVCCLVLCVAFLLPFVSSALPEYVEKKFSAPAYPVYTDDSESTLEFEYQYTEYEWFGFKITDTKTGEVYYSNPAHEFPNTASYAAERQRIENSQIILSYSYDPNGDQSKLQSIGYVSSSSSVATYYSFDDCMARDQVVFEEIIENGKLVGLKVDYGFGLIKVDVYPEVISESSMLKWKELAVDENGNPKEDVIKTIDKKYSFISLESLNASMERELKRTKDEDAKAKAKADWEKKIADYREQFPILETGEGVYIVFSDAVSSKYKKSQVVDAWAQTGFTRADLEAEYEKLGYESTGSGVIIHIPVIYKIEGNTFIARVLTDEIELPPEVAIQRIDILPQFGAMTGDDIKDGYAFVPDGSGSIIEFGKNAARASSISIAIGSRHYDEGLSRVGNAIHTIPLFETAVLPVFGMKQNNRAIFGVFEQGYELGNVNTTLRDGSVNQYHFQYCSSYLTPTDGIYYSNGSSAGITMFPKVSVETKTVDAKGKETVTTDHYCRLPDSDIQVRYTFLYDEEANYSGMANWFRNYYMKLYGIEKLQAAENTSFYADYYGAIMKKISFLGFPINVKYALTDFNQASEITDALLQKVKGLNIRYLGMANGALYTTDFSNHFDVLKKLGGLNGFNDFLDKYSALGVKISPDVDLQHVFKDKAFDGFTPYNDAVRTLGKVQNIIQNHNLATGFYGTVTHDDEGYYFPRWVVTPELYETVFAEFEADYSKIGNKDLSISTVGSTLSADYQEEMIIDRTQTSRIVSESLKQYKEKGYSITTDVGNYWALPYVDVVRSIPTGASKYLVEDYDIPFVQMVLHGLINYTGEELNVVQNNSYQVLKCLEYGCSLSARLMYEDDIALQKTYYTTLLYSMNYRNWIDTIGEMYNTVNEVMKDVQDQFIIEHERIDNNVFCSTYENGLKVLVNYNAESVSIDYEGVNYTIDGMGFITVKGGNN